MLTDEWTDGRTDFDITELLRDRQTDRRTDRRMEKLAPMSQKLGGQGDVSCKV